MEIREATEADIPAIVALLKLSLGESLMPKSEEYWRWKQIENPFGQSPALLCWEGSTLIGVRAFMRWQWKEEGRLYSAVRAVDTATHPDHQGKGIFKKLTLALVDFCKEKDHFVFNTPNAQSKPGYLKMGWEEAGKLPINVTVMRPVGMLSNFIYHRDGVKMEDSSLIHYLEHPGLDALVADQLDEIKNITTNFSRSYLKWRYLDVPVAEYVAIGEEEGSKLTGLIIGRIKKSRLGNEFRVTDYFSSGERAGDGLIAQIRKNKKRWKIDYCTTTGTAEVREKSFLRYFTLKAPIGPVVTVRSLGLTDLSALKNFNKWSPSLGDLELF
jgi:GNAT superfamily N-acetyltransferase